MEAVKSGSLPQVRRTLRLIDELDPQYRGRLLNIELLSTFNLEPLLPVLQLALNCIPSQAHIQLGPKGILRDRHRQVRLPRSMRGWYSGG